MTIVVIAYEQDLHADSVVGMLGDATEVLRVDPFVGGGCFEFLLESCDSFMFDGEKVNFSEVSGVYCRLALESLEVDACNPLDKFAFKEYLGALNGILLNIPENRWMNYPWAEAKVDGKIRPLIQAKKLGIDVPNFFVSNNPETLKLVLKSSGRFVIKPITDAPIARQHGLHTDAPDFCDYFAPYTSEITLREVDFELLDDTPYLIQEKIRGDLELRVCVVDFSVFVTCSEPCETVVDVRLQARINERLGCLPQGLSSSLVKLTDRLGLRTATYDLIVESALGKFWLVDVNPSGNWLWQERQFDLPISRAIAVSLLKSDKCS